MNSKLLISLFVTLAFSAWSSDFTITGEVQHAGAADGSAGIAVDNDYFIGATDENNLLRLYAINGTKAGIQLMDLNPLLGFPQEDGEFKECDLEGAARLGDVIYWIGSHGRNKKGNVKLSRRVLFATAVSGMGATTKLEFKGKPCKNLLEALVKKVPELANAATIKPEDEGGLNIESLCAQGGTLLIGFRNPVSSRGALVVPLTNPLDVIAEKLPQLGEPFRLNLQGRGIRDMMPWHSQILIVAGDFKDLAADGAKAPKLFSWSGQPKDGPVALDGELGNLNPEAALVFGDEGKEELQLLSDDGGSTFRSVRVKMMGSN